MFKSAEEFVDVLEHGTNERWQELRREKAPLKVWMEVVDEYPEYKEQVLMCKEVPVEVLERLVSDPEKWVRDWVARKRKLPRDLMGILKDDPDPGVQATLIRNKSTPESILEYVAENGAEDWVREEADKLLEKRDFEE
jgi:hypothetical protein